MKLVEPLRELFKDEARALGRELGLPDVFVGHHPFPRPGLAIRCLGEITAEKLEILRFADEIYIEEIRRAGLYDDIWQAFGARATIFCGVLPSATSRSSVVRSLGLTYRHASMFRMPPFNLILQALGNPINGSEH